MNRASLFARLAAPFTVKSSSMRETAQLRLEPLEERKLLTTTPTYMNDNWVNVDGPEAPLIPFVTTVVNSADAVNPGSISATYGLDAFGKVGGLTVNGYGLIKDAIAGTDPGGELMILGGTYAESDILVNKAITINGQGQSGAGLTLIVPEVTSDKSTVSSFGVSGTHNGFILYSPSVTIENLKLDGSGNGALGGGGYNYHHGITTLYDSQPGGSVATQHDGLKTPYNFGSDHSTSSLMVRDVTVTNTWYHGITISGLASKTIGTNTVQNVTVSNVGPVGSQDLNRIGILIQNNDKGQVLTSNVSAVGVGIASSILGTGTFGSNSSARNKSGILGSTVTDAVQRGYSLEFADGQLDLNFIIDPTAYINGFDNNVAKFNNPANNATGLYINHSQPVAAGFISNGAKIGIHVQNTTFDDLLFPAFTGDTLIGPGSGVAGSVGILAENSLAEPNKVVFAVAGVTSITGFATGIKTNQATPAGDGVNLAQIDRVTLTGNAVGVDLGNNAVVNGSLQTTDPFKTSGSAIFTPGYPVSPFMVLDGTTSPAIIAGPDAALINSGALTLDSTSTYSPTLGAPNAAVTTLFNFNNAATYEFGVLPAGPENGTVPVQFQTSWDGGQVVQDGLGQLVIGNGALNGPLQLLYGVNAHPQDDFFVFDPIDISNQNTLNLVAKKGATNQAIGFLFALVDYDGDLSFFTVPFSELSSTAFTTYSINLLAPGIPLSLGGDGTFDLSRVTGYAILGDAGLFNGLKNVPFSLTLDDINATTVANSKMNVTGAVTLSGATLGGTFTPGFTPSLGQQFTIIDNDGADPVSGTFAGVAQNGYVTISGSTFKVNYSGGTGNDVVLTREDAPVVVPDISVNTPAAVAEGNAGTTPIVFTISLSAAAASNVTVAYATTNGTATAPSDFTAVSGTATFTPGQTTQLVTVLVNGDTAVEPNESFTLNLSSATNGTITGATGTGTINNDDVALASTVVGRKVFYNQSKFDGSTSGVSTSDDLAIATDKVALLPGAGQANFTNITSYTRGINGIMVDISGTHGTLTASDFIFKVGANNTPSLWASPLETPTVTVRAGAGTGGSDRVEIIFTAANSPKNQWLQVIVKGNDTRGSFNTNTGLAASDIFFFGNRIGEDGSGTVGQAITSFVDENGAKTHGGIATITNVWDFDRSGLVSSVDSLAARFNAGTLLKINIANPPAAPEAAPAVATDSGIASALAAKALPKVEKLPTWVTDRLASLDVPGGRIANVFSRLIEEGGPRTSALQKVADKLADRFGLDDSLLDDLLAGLKK